MANLGSQASFSSQCGQCFYCEKGQTSRCPEYYLFGQLPHGKDESVSNLGGNRQQVN